MAFLLPLFFNPWALADPFESGKVRLFQLIVLGMAAVAVWPRPEKRPWNPLFGPVMVYGLVVGLATAVSIDRRASLWGDAYPHGALLTLTLLLFFVLLADAWQNHHQVEQMINIILMASVPVTIYGIIQFLGFDPLDWSHDSVSPVHATLGRSLYLGGYLAMILPFTALRLFQCRERRRIAWGVILLLQLCCLIFTLARGAWLGFLGSIILAAVLLANQRRYKLWLMGLLLTVGAAALFLISQRGWALFPTLSVNADLGRVRAFSLAARLTTWQDALALVPGRWLLGYGPETYGTAVQQYLGITPGPYDQHLPDPHNLLLYQATAVGLAGLLAFLWIIGRFYVMMLAKFRQTNSRERRLLLVAVLSSLTAYLIQAQFNPDVITLSAFFWINLASGIVLLRQEVTSSDNNLSRSIE